MVAVYILLKQGKAKIATHLYTIGFIGGFIYMAAFLEDKNYTLLLLPVTMLVFMLYFFDDIWVRRLYLISIVILTYFCLLHWLGLRHWTGGF